MQSKSLKATQTNAFKILVKTLDVKNADQQAEFILDMLKGLKLKPNALMKVKRNLSDLNEASIPADLYVNAPVAIGAILSVLTGVGLLARHEIKKAQKEIQAQMSVAVTDADIKKGEQAISENSLNEAGIPADLYVNAPVAIGAILSVLTGVGLLARHEIKKAQKEIQAQMSVAVTDSDIKKGESAISESKRRK